jgi:hypothetical protein
MAYPATAKRIPDHSSDAAQSEFRARIELRKDVKWLFQARKNHATLPVKKSKNQTGGGFRSAKPR